MVNGTPSAEDVLSLRRDSIVYRVDKRPQGVLVCKSYTPERFEEMYTGVFGAEGSPFRILSYPDEKRQELFNREVAVLTALSRQEPQMVPMFIEIKEKNRDIYMENVPDPTFQEEFLASSPKIYDLTRQMIKILARFHNHCDQNLDSIKREAKSKGKERIRERVGEDKTRWRNYLETIIYHCSTDFDKYGKTKQVDYTKLKPATIRRHIRDYLSDQGVNLRLEVKTFIDRDKEITKYGQKGTEATFVAGDFGPQNIFNMGDSDEIRVFDFDKSRLGPRDIDLVSAIYHIHRYPFSKDGEAQALELATDYFTEVRVPPEYLPERLAGLVSSRLKAHLRLFAVYCQMSPEEIKRFIGERRVREYLHVGEASLPTGGEPTTPEGEKLRPEFLQDMFVNYFRKFFDYYRYRQGEGWELALEKLLLENPGGRKQERETLLRQIRDQFKTVEEILTITGVMRGEITSKSREKRFKNILSP